MAEVKTKKTTASVTDFIAAVKNDTRREDARVLLKLMRKITGKQPKMWGPSIIGFGQYHYKYKTGHEGDICKIGFSPRSQSLVLYIMPGFKKYGVLMKKLGKHKIGKACLYINKLADVDLAVLEELISESYRFTNDTYDQS